MKDIRKCAVGILLVTLIVACQTTLNEYGVMDFVDGGREITFTKAISKDVKNANMLAGKTIPVYNVHFAYLSPVKYPEDMLAVLLQNNIENLIKDASADFIKFYGLTVDSSEILKEIKDKGFKGNYKINTYPTHNGSSAEFDCGIDDLKRMTLTFMLVDKYNGDPAFINVHSMVNDDDPIESYMFEKQLLVLY